MPASRTAAMSSSASKFIGAQVKRAKEVVAPVVSKAKDKVDPVIKAVKDKVVSIGDSAKDVLNKGGGNSKLVTESTDQILPSTKNNSTVSVARHNAWNEFQKDHKGIFKSRVEARKAYYDLIENQSPWPYGFDYKSTLTTESSGSFRMITNKGKPNEPGRFGTIDEIPNKKYGRNELAIKKLGRNR